MARRFDGSVVDISAEFDQDTQRDQLLQELIEGSRAALGTVQAALEMLAYPDLDASQRERFQGVVREEVGRLGERVTQVAQRSGPALHPRWPLHDMPGTQLLTALSRRIQAQTGLLTETADVAADLWLKVDSFSLIHALSALAARLASESTVQAVALRLTTSGRHAQLAVRRVVAQAVALEVGFVEVADDESLFGIAGRKFHGDSLGCC